MWPPKPVEIPALIVQDAASEPDRLDTQVIPNPHIMASNQDNPNKETSTEPSGDAEDSRSGSPVVDQPGTSETMSAAAAGGRLGRATMSLRGGCMIDPTPDTCLPCENGDTCYDTFCYWIFGPGSENP